MSLFWGNLSFIFISTVVWVWYIRNTGTFCWYCWFVHLSTYLKYVDYVYIHVSLWIFYISMCVMGLLSLCVWCSYECLSACVFVCDIRSQTPLSRGVCRCCPGMQPLLAPRHLSRPVPRPPPAFLLLLVPHPKWVHARPHSHRLRK